MEEEEKQEEEEEEEREEGEEEKASKAQQEEEDGGQILPRKRFREYIVDGTIEGSIIDIHVSLKNLSFAIESLLTRSIFDELNKDNNDDNNNDDDDDDNDDDDDKNNNNNDNNNSESLILENHDGIVCTMASNGLGHSRIARTVIFRM
uniref:Uncharacterized protein n=1 Tax=Vespula pensylvanica TaxID=30213 RepID=A0A834UFS2_VESPE|nr:hypothetical protein H0235_003977 [Vespula pensylvanica]